MGEKDWGNKCVTVKIGDVVVIGDIRVKLINSDKMSVLRRGRLMITAPKSLKINIEKSDSNETPRIG